MAYIRGTLWSAFVSGALVLLPIYLAVLLVLKATQSIGGLIRPFAKLLPAWVPGEEVISLAVVFVLCVLIGLAGRTQLGRGLRERLEKSFFERVPGYALFRSLTQQVAGRSEGGNAWQPALIEIEDALVPGFIIEEVAGGRYTVFVPSVPTPLAGAVYVLARERVHPVKVPFTQAVKTVSHWGSGAKELVAAMEREPGPVHAADAS
jgi:uncharacterized membrane protein